MPFTRFMAAQLRQPSGWFGSLLLSRVMNRVNLPLIDSTLALLELNPEHHVLEIGFGGGSALARLAQTQRSGRITGVDVSPDMVRKAERRFRREIAQGRVHVELGDVSYLPFTDAAFDRVFTINTIYFWSDALSGLREIRRVLKDGCLAAVSLRSKDKMQRVAVTRYNFRLFSPQEVADLMKQAAYRDIRVDHSDQSKLYDEVIVIGSR